MTPPALLTEPPVSIPHPESLPASEPILTIYNKHVTQCGTPSAISNNSPDTYVGYFENSFGEQWIFTYDRKNGTGVLQGGDADWQNAYPVHEGTVPHLVLSHDEIAWLHACWTAATRFMQKIGRVSRAS